MTDTGVGCTKQSYGRGAGKPAESTVATVFTFLEDFLMASLAIVSVFAPIWVPFYALPLEISGDLQILETIVDLDRTIMGMYGDMSLSSESAASLFSSTASEAEMSLAAEEFAEAAALVVLN